MPRKPASARTGEGVDVAGDWRRRRLSTRAGVCVAAATALVAIVAATGTLRPPVAPGARTTVPAPLTPVPQFDHVVVVVFENKALSRVLGNSDAPTFAKLADSYATLLDYRAITHPSLPNYLALVSGSTQGITDDCTRCVVDAPNLVDTLEAAGKTWKAYAQGLPAPGFNGDGEGRYAKRHVPFLYFRDILTRPSRRRRIVPLPVFARDLARHTLPTFSFVVPDLCNDMHDCPVATGDAWLRRFIWPLLASREMERSVVFVLFDESDDRSADAGGIVPAVVAGPLVRVGVRSKALLDHYSLLRTIEDGLRLPRLGLSATARPITGVWRAPR